MASERFHERQKAAQEAEERLVAGMAESAELESFRGRPLDLGDGSPTWFINRLLRREGVSHPLIERGRDVDEAIAGAQRTVEPLYRWRSRLTSASEPPSAQDVRLFNLRRTQVLQEFVERLAEVNEMIRDHNLMVPAALHRRPFPIPDTVDKLAQEIPALPEPAAPQPERPGWSVHRVWRLIGRRGG